MSDPRGILSPPPVGGTTIIGPQAVRRVGKQGEERRRQAQDRARQAGKNKSVKHPDDNQPDDGQPHIDITV